MAKRGRKMTPTALKELRGNPGRRPLPEREPKPTVELPDPPEQLDADALREWARIGPQLERLRLVTEIDRSVLALYCQAYGRWVQATASLERIKAGEFDSKSLSVWFNVERKAREEVARYAPHFGLSPSTRTGVVTAEAERALSPVADFRSRRPSGSGAA